MMIPKTTISCTTGVLYLCVVATTTTTTDAYQQQLLSLTAPRRQQRATHLSARKTLLKQEQSYFDPLKLATMTTDIYASSRRPMATTPPSEANQENDELTRSSGSRKVPVATAAAATALTILSEKAVAVDSLLSTGSLNPDNFQPVCPASDGFYRVLQQGALSVIGKENFVEFGPLIAGGLLRVRLELCVVESFFNEAVGPFIQENGVSWILPLHETVQTFLAGGIFALATTFILIGSTKILTVIVTYADFLFGFPARLFGGFAFDRAQGKPVTLDIGFGPFKTRVIGPPEPKEGETSSTFKMSDASAIDFVVLALSGTVRTFGQILGVSCERRARRHCSVEEVLSYCHSPQMLHSQFIREALEAIDAFVGRYLVLWASGYLLIKFLHFKVFPDFP